jgi:hypothetical protein
MSSLVFSTFLKVDGGVLLRTCDILGSCCSLVGTTPEASWRPQELLLQSEYLHTERYASALSVRFHELIKGRGATKRRPDPGALFLGRVGGRHVAKPRGGRDRAPGTTPAPGAVVAPGTGMGLLRQGQAPPRRVACPRRGELHRAPFFVRTVQSPPFCLFVFWFLFLGSLGASFQHSPSTKGAIYIISSQGALEPCRCYASSWS